MPEEHEDVEGKLLNSPEVYQQTKFMAWFEKAFPWLLVGVAALGLIFMIFLPGAFFQKETAEQLKAQGDLRLALLYTTGGAIAALGLLETYRKNTNDRAKANADINAALKNQEHQTKVLKEQIRQFNENAFKERKAERRERYTKAVEQLGDEKAPVRMGGVYTLVGLVDEWLEEESIRKYEDRLKEGQVIINNLCAYIRSPFTLASHYDELMQDTPDAEGVYQDKVQEFYADKATLDSETDVRLSIIKEIHDRLQGSGKNTPGAWSDFEYDFSGSTFFYPIDLTNSYYAKPINFSGSIYKGWANFRNSIYRKEANFEGSIYKGEADFGGSTYRKEANFGGSTYKDRAYFRNSIYEGWANFRNSTYKGRANFRNSTYKGGADFSRSIFYQETYFGEDRDINSFSRFTNFAPQFYDETNNRNTLFGSHNNDFTVDTNEGYPIVLNSEGIPLKCEFLNSEQKKHLENIFQEIEKINNKLFEVKDPIEKAELSEKLWSLNKELYKWREEATTVKVENVATEDTER